MEAIFRDILVQVNGTTPLEEKAFNQLCDEILRLSNLQREDLKAYLPKLIATFKGQQQQAQLATELGHWALNHESPTEAIHYYATALKIEESQERHRFASSVFMDWVIQEEIFKKRLEIARGQGKPEAFHQILDQFDELKRLCTDSRQMDRLISQAKEALTTKASLLQVSSFETCADRINNLNPHFTPSELISKRYHSALNKFRESFSKSDVFQRTKHFIDLFELFIRDAFILIGPPPCGYDLRAMGSIGKHRACPSSDLEWFILIENTLHQRYFQMLARVIDMQIRSLGESPASECPIFTILGPEQPCGLHVDANPSDENTFPLIEEPEAMAQLHEIFPDEFDLLAFSTFQSISLKTSNPRLYQTYQRSINPDTRKIHALRSIRERRESYEKTWTGAPEDLEEFDLKKDCVSFLDYLLCDLALYFGIEKTEPGEIAQELQNLEIFKDVRLIQKSSHEIYAMRSSNLHVLTRFAPQVDWVHRAYWLILRPLYSHVIDKIIQGEKHIDLLSEALIIDPKGDMRPLLQYLIDQHVLVESPFETHREILSQLCTSLRTTYFQTLERHNLRYFAELAAIPARDGSRYAQVMEARDLERSIEGMTTDNTASGVCLKTPAIKTAYLKQECAAQILDSTGHINRQYERCLHRVASLPDHQLHFKQNPNHSLMEYAIHTLTYRIMGRGTPSVELARFEVDNGLTYPVLISRTIEGESLNNFQDIPLDNGHLTWMQLCAILIRPGDGRGSNYVINNLGKIFCIDNDVSFVEPVIKEGYFQNLQFCSVLFSLEKRPLDKMVLHQFTLLDPERILTAWIEDLIEKESQFLCLFSEEERRQLYEKDKLTVALLLREGVVSTLLLQFIHLQQVIQPSLQKDQDLYPEDLLKEILTLKNNAGKSMVGPWIAKRYASASSKLLPDEALRSILRRTPYLSMTTPSVMQATFGKIPTLEELESGELYSLEKAKEELMVLCVQRYLGMDETTLYSGVLFAHFEKIQKEGAPDIERQELVLKALTALVQSGYFNDLKKVTLSDCAALTDANLTTFLSPTVHYLDLRHCPNLTYQAVGKIADLCPNLQELYLSATSISAVASYGVLKWFPIAMKHLQILHVGQCRKLTTISLDAPALVDLKVKNSPDLTRITLNGKRLSDSTVFFGTHSEALNPDFYEIGLMTLCAQYEPPLNPVLVHFFEHRLGKEKVATVIQEATRYPKTFLKLNNLLLDDRDAKVLAFVLEHSQTLSSLELNGNEITDEGALFLAGAMWHNQSLKFFSLLDNPLNEKGKHSLRQASKQRGCTLRFDSPPVTQKAIPNLDWEMIRKLQKRYQPSSYTPPELPSFTTTDSQPKKKVLAKELPDKQTLDGKFSLKDTEREKILKELEMNRTQFDCSLSEKVGLSKELLGIGGLAFMLMPQEQRNYLMKKGFEQFKAL